MFCTGNMFFLFKEKKDGRFGPSIRDDVMPPVMHDGSGSRPCRRSVLGHAIAADAASSAPRNSHAQNSRGECPVLFFQEGALHCSAPTTQPENALTTKALGGTTSDDVRPRIHANSSCDSTSWMYFSRFCIGGSRIEIKILCTVGSCMHGPCPSSVGVEWDWTDAALSDPHASTVISSLLERMPPGGPLAPTRSTARRNKICSERSI